MRLSVWVLAASLTSATFVSADNWPRFRGPNGTGIAKDMDIPVEWTANSGILWKTALPGVGNSSPIVWGDRLFLQSSSADGKKRSLVCINTNDGKIVWSKSVPAAKGKIHPKSSLASSTPATNGELVFNVFWDGDKQILTAYDFHGEQKWSQDLGSFKSQHGAGASPIVVNGVVVLANDQDGKSAVVAFDAKTGKPAWESVRKPFRACYSAPMIREGDNGKPEIVVASTAGLTAYEPATGKEVWNWSFTGKTGCRCVASLIQSHGLLVAALGNGEGDRHMVAVKPGNNGEGKPTRVWENLHKTLPYVPTQIAWGDHLYSVTDRGPRGTAICQSAKTGEVIWEEPLGPSFSASPVLVDGKVYAVNEEGTVFVFPADTTYKLLAKDSVGERVLASPAVADNRLYIRGESHLFCIGKPPSK